MSELSKAAGEGKLPLQDPRILAVSRSSPNAGGGSGTKSSGGSAGQGQDRSASLEKEDKGKDGGKQSEPRQKADSANQLNQYREQLARDMQRQGLGVRPGQSPGQPSRVSPILEEAFAPNSPSPMSPPSTTSTIDSVESNQTIRGGITPSIVNKTPSYPFPRVGTPGYIPSSIHKPFTTLSPTGTASNLPSSSAMAAATFGATRPQDKILSNPSTPASAMSFQPFDVLDQENPDFPTPNLYDLSLMLSSEPGLDAWWRTVVHIMTVYYKAERLTLSVPADSTDLENVPWGQKATYNARQEDSLSMEYMARGSSLVPSSVDDLSELASPAGDILSAKLQAPSRPQIQSRHSFTAFEDEKERNVTSAKPSPIPKRPGFLSRSKSTYPGTPGADHSRMETPHMGLNKQALAEHDAEEPDFPDEWEAPTPQKENHGRVFELLQALDYEADPLIDHHGVTRVLERGRVIALTRSYPYLEDMILSKPAESKPVARSHSPEGIRTKGKRLRHESSTKLSNILSSAHQIRSHPHNRRPGQNIDKMISEGEPRRPPTPKYEEYEQTPPSPWSQSPAPSPAIRADPKDNPFFTDAVVDESSFNPTQKTPDYSAIGPQEAIGVDNAWTVLHIPLRHPLLSKPSGFKLDATLMEQRSSRRGKDSASDIEGKHESDTFRKEKQTPIAILSILSTTIPYPSNLRYSLEHLSPHLATSFSLCRHYSSLESELARMHHRRPRIAGFGAVDPEGRPITDPAILNYAVSEDVADQSITGSLTSPSEYSTRSRSIAGTPGGTPGWETTSLGGVMDKRPAVPSPAPVGGDSYFTTKSRSASKTDLASAAQQRVRRNSRGSTTSEKRSSLRLSGGLSLDSGCLSPDINEVDVAEDVAGRTSDDLPTFTFPKRGSNKEAPVERKDEKEKTAESKGISRSESLPANSPEMAFPTDKLKDLILDSLPAQLFVALPGAGGIVWVNSRYLAYRGQSLAELHADAHASIHPDDRDTYLRAWGRAVKTGTDFHMNVRIRRFDGAFRCFSARVVACRNKRNEIVHHLGSYTDIHEQTMAELKLVRQQEIEASEAKYRFLANLIPQIIFTATEDEGITFANEQWLAYTGQSEEDAMGLGFMDYVHPDDLAKCRIPPGQSSRNSSLGRAKAAKRQPETPKADRIFRHSASKSTGHPETNIRGVHYPLSRQNSSSSDSVYELPSANLTELAKEGIVKVGTDSNGRLSYATEIRLRSKSGEYRWHLIRCVEIDNIGNSVNSYFGSATDINDHKLLEAKLKEAMESKSRFLSNMSHEIRTPLIGISGMVSFLQDTTLNEEQRDYTNTIQTSANSLLMIINDILDLSKVDAGMMKLKHEWFHTRALIEDVNELVSAMAIARRLELNYIVEEDVPTWIKGDRVRIRQILLNVIGNAIKFTESGEVFSRCRVKTGAPGLGENQTMLEFAVIDTGRGFTEEEAKLIFKPFSQIDGSSTRAHGGSGLGLVISRQLVELHGGRMEGTAKPGEGATFTFTAKFGLPTEEDHPDAPISSLAPQTPAIIEDIPTQPFRQFTITKHRGSPVVSPTTVEPDSSPAVASSGSSNPSVTSTGTRVTGRSSISSVNAGLARFSEAARASGQDLSQMKLEMPSGRISPGHTPAHDYPGSANYSGDFRPPMFSILVICPQKYSREATVQHIEMTLPKDVPHQITALATAQEAEQLIGRDDPVIFTHVLINLPSAEEIIRLMEEIGHSTLLNKATVVILSDSIQRQALSKLVEGTDRADLISDNKITYVYKPVKPSRLAVIFDPAKERDMSVDRNRSSAQRIVENQKKSYQEVEKRMGNKGYKVLLVEDNPVNQKVLKKYLVKVGLEVELAMDGEECTNMVFGHPHGFYSLILCDLHMPRKDGYQACREVRAWEEKNHYKKLPIIALSANVMSDVQEKCVEAGFSDYVTKPVDFIDLSTALSKFF
ncbi:Peroxide stress-activated histidine kinase mak1 [Cytospora mali]|uniref:histidine kinase n=1 Tax=Cytospora mali TaxID=578113 RepID=A0A194V433_CYTMA|nr:Peroxide stress-activated histidine kinase mak1 [Valsa mali var. pyri (nom. inval.)]